ncbi:MAG TPA: hypothetical protein VG710_09370 [Opitutus sp.]|nr:hypothetical protein [Opitutus sp.]
MARIRQSFGIRHLAFGIAATAAVAATAQVTAPAHNWVLPLFSPEGYRSMIARGSEARALDQHQFEVTDLNLTLFTGDATARVDTVILSPAATFLPDQKEAHGENSVRVIRDDVEAFGTRWTYWHDQKKISLDGNVRVTFQAELKDLLK